MAYSNQHIDDEIPHGLRDHFIVSNTVSLILTLNQQAQHVVLLTTQSG